MASQNQVLEALKGFPDGTQLAGLAQALGVPTTSITRTVKSLKDKGYITRDDDGVYQITDEGLKSLESKPPLKVEVLPTEYDKFKEIGGSLGLKDPFLTNVCDYVFQLGSEDISKVYEALLRLSLRPDVVQRWVALWSTFLGKPLPQKVVEATAPVVSNSPLQEKRYSIIGSGATARIIDDPAGVTHTEALKELDLRLSHAQTQTSGGSEEMKAMREELKELREALVNQQVASLKEAIAGQNQKITELLQSQRTENAFAVMGKVVDQGFGELKGLRNDVKGGFETMAKLQIPPRQKSEAERQRISAIGKVEIEKERRARELEDELLQMSVGGYQPRETRPAAPPPQVIAE
jgi:DNA-binding MarR family transcriptional regulator